MNKIQNQESEDEEVISKYLLIQSQLIAKKICLKQRLYATFIALFGLFFIWHYYNNGGLIFMYFGDINYLSEDLFIRHIFLFLFLIYIIRIFLSHGENIEDVEENTLLIKLLTEKHKINKLSDNFLSKLSNNIIKLYSELRFFDRFSIVSLPIFFLYIIIEGTFFLSYFSEFLYQGSHMFIFKAIGLPGINIGFLWLLIWAIFKTGYNVKIISFLKKIEIYTVILLIISIFSFLNTQSF